MIKVFDAKTFERNVYAHLEATDVSVKRTQFYCLSIYPFCIHNKNRIFYNMILLYLYRIFPAFKKWFSISSLLFLYKDLICQHTVFPVLNNCSGYANFGAYYNSYMNEMLSHFIFELPI